MSHGDHDIDPGEETPIWLGMLVSIVILASFLALIFPYQKDPLSHTRVAEAAQK